MQKYKNISEKIKKIEYKLGVSYVKTSNSAYKRLRIFNMICVIYLLGINTLTLLSAYLHKIWANEFYFTRLTYILLIVGTLMEVGGVVLNFFKIHVIGNLLNIIPLPYFVCVFAPMLKHPEGLFGYRVIFYTRHLISYVFILILSLVMIFIAVRQQIKARLLYKKILENIYEEYKKKKGEEDFSVSEADWDKYVKNFDPRKQKLK
ncbi:MAG: hypothetical protein J5766_00800 [Clostridia bacterium]|nr:hypothetical protein [Clostridia bacterium]